MQRETVIVAVGTLVMLLTLMGFVRPRGMTMPDNKLTSLIGSRRFWAAIGGVALVFSEHFGLGFTPEEIEKIVMLIGAWILGDSLQKTGTDPQPPVVVEQAGTVVAEPRAVKRKAAKPEVVD